jgi:RNA polymerase sigma-32 factor
MARKRATDSRARTDPAPEAPAPASPAPLAAPAEAELVEEPADRGSSIVPTDPYQRYLAEIRKYPRLTREQEQALAIRYREEGDREAARILATANLRLVVRIAMDYRRAYMNLLDLIQEGNVGLLQAVTKYDPYRGVPFSAYAGYWIRAYILKYLLDHWSLVRVGTTNIRRRLFYNLRREQQRLEREGIVPGAKLLARSFGAEEEDVVDVSRALKGRDVSIDQPIRKSEGSEDLFLWQTMASEAAGPDEQIAREELQEILREKIGAFAEGLKEKDRFILQKRLLAEEPLTLQAIGDQYGTTREAVRQAETRLIRKLKDYLKREIEDLKSFEIDEE